MLFEVQLDPGDHHEDHHRPPGDAVERAHHLRVEHEGVVVGIGAAQDAGAQQHAGDDLHHHQRRPIVGVPEAPDQVGQGENDQHRDRGKSRSFPWLLGDQLTIVALPWLVLKLTGSALALGLVVALMGIPRAVFILLGGAMVDRYSPKRVLMISKIANAVLLGLVSGFVLGVEPGATWQLGPALTIVMGPRVILSIIGGFAFFIGLAQAFGIPSGTAMMPHALPPQHLQAANGMLMGLRQLSMLVGPLLAALLIAVAGDGMGAGAVADARGLAWAFGLDCISFLVSAWTLSRVALRVTARPEGDKQSVLRSVGAGLRMVWDDVALRLCFTYWGIVTLFIGGSMQVALPVLANDTLHGASTLGCTDGGERGRQPAGHGGGRGRRQAIALRQLRHDAAAGRCGLRPVADRPSAASTRPGWRPSCCSCLACCRAFCRLPSIPGSSAACRPT
jgi:MFS family permease